MTRQERSNLLIEVIASSGLTVICCFDTITSGCLLFLFQLPSTVKLRGHLCDKKSAFIRQVNSYQRFNVYEMSMPRQEKSNLLMQMTA